MEDKKPGISLDDWLDNPTAQGLPKPDAKDGSLYFWHARADAVARFYAGSDWAGLNCNGDPSYRNSDLGVRRVKAKVGGKS